VAHATINLKKNTWINVGQFPCRVQASGKAVQIQANSGTYPSSSEGAVILEPNFGLTSDEMADTFAGVVSPTTVWALSKELGGKVSVSHA
jgi:hypothetical protein